jgi:hypothetical protein
MTRRLVDKAALTISTSISPAEAEQLQTLMDRKNWSVSVALREAMRAMLASEGIVDRAA